MGASVPEIVDFFVRLEDDPERRGILEGSPFQIFQAAVKDRLVERLEQNRFALLVGKAVNRKLIDFELTQAGVVQAGAVWSDHDFQARSCYFVTPEGRQLVDLYRRGQGAGAGRSSGRPTRTMKEHRDCFICHASEDKDIVRPLAEALTSRGWKVWLDELDLTLGDSLNFQIEAALADTRFGIVILSHAFFAKEWTQRELGALAAREIDAKTKVILPVWHGIDHHFIVERSPVLADRLGVSTDVGIEKVAAEVSRAIEEAGIGREENDGTEGAGVDAEREGEALLSVPTSREERENLVASGADWWEYRLFAGAMMEGQLALESKWQDHELRLLDRSRHDLGTQSIASFLSREMGWLKRQIATLDRIFDPAVLEEAFGAPGVAGDSGRIEAAARRLISIYESLLDWAAKIRNTDVASQQEDVIELAAQMVDQPLQEIRDFIRTCADQVARFAVLSRSGTEEDPVEITLTLRLTIDDRIQDQIIAALERAS